MFIRVAKPVDAERFVLLMKQVESEAEFMLMESGERKMTPEQQRKWLERMENESNSVVFVAENEGGDLVGYVVAIGGNTIRTKHSAYLVIGILKEYTGRGIGTKLFQNINDWAVTQNLHRLELTVVIENEAGVALYKKMGFEVEGIKRKSLHINDKLYDQFHMAKLL